MTEYVKFSQSPIAYDGWIIIAVGFFLSLVFVLLAFWLPAEDFVLGRSILLGLASLGLVFVAFSLWFFRNPERTPASNEPGVVVSAADGRVLKVEQVNDPRYGAPSWKISIFMSPLNVHVNRSPVQGVVEKVEYVPGKFFAANLDKASTDNERNLVIVKTPTGQRVGFLQIAGFIARRIVCSVQPGNALQLGQRYGLIRFGSRMEIFLPEKSEIRVKAGDHLMAGHSVVGKLPTGAF